MKALISNWDKVQQAIRIFLYTILPLIGFSQAQVENYVVTGLTILGLILNICWTIFWNKKEVVTVAGAINDAQFTLADKIEQVKKKVKR